MRRAAVLVCVLVLAGACSSTDGAAGDRAPTTTASSRPASAYQQVVEQMQPDGSFSKDTALQLFALQYGPVPGVAVPGGGRGPAESGTMSVQAVFRVWGELSDEQRGVVLDRLELPDDYDPAAASTAAVAEPTVPGRLLSGGKPVTLLARGHRSTARPAESPAAAAYVDSYRRAAWVLEGELGEFRHDVDLVSSDEVVRGPDGSPALADAITVPGGTCRIRVFPATFPTPSRNQIATLAHELGHCYQQWWNGGASLGRAAWWVEEGGAEWMGNAAQAQWGGGPDEGGIGFQDQWSDEPDAPLFDRTYDAWPWFAYAEEKVPGLWGRMRSVVLAGSGVAAYNAAVGTTVTPDWLRGWSSGQVMSGRAGPDWTVRGSGTRPRSSALPTRSLANGVVVPLGAPAYATNHGAVTLDAEVVRLTVGAGALGRVRVDRTDRTLEELANRPWCTGSSDRECTCPAGTRRAGQVIPRLEGNAMLVAVGNGDAPVTAQLEGRSLRDECEAGQGCPVGTWVQTTPSPMRAGTRLVSGGTGTTLTVAEDGALVQDFSTYQPLTASYSSAGRTGTVYFAPTGTIRARVTLPADGGTFTTSPVTGVDASGLGGTGYTDVDGMRLDLPPAAVGAAVSFLTSGGAFGPARTGALSLRCEGEDRVVVDAGAGVTQTYERRR